MQKKVSEFYEYRDDFYNETICEDCFNRRFIKELKARNKEWFLKNFNDEDYPKSFWDHF